MTRSIDFEKLSMHEGPEDSPGFLLWKVSTLWRRKIEEVLKEVDLTHPQFVILATTAWLTKNKKLVAQIEIAKQAGLDPNTTSQILRSLEKKEFIERSYVSDERSKHPVLTKKGSSVLAKALPMVEKADALFFSCIDVKKSGIVHLLLELTKASS